MKCVSCDGDTEEGYPTLGFKQLMSGEVDLGLHCDACSLVIVATICLKMGVRGYAQLGMDGFQRYLEMRAEAQDEPVGGEATDLLGMVPSGGPNPEAS